MTDSDKVIKILGRKIRQARKAKNLSQQGLALVMHMSSHYAISHWENGGRDINTWNLTDLHRALGVPLWGLLPTEDEMNMTEAELMQLLEGE